MFFVDIVEGRGDFVLSQNCIPHSPACRNKSNRKYRNVGVAVIVRRAAEARELIQIQVVAGPSPPL